MRTALQKQPKLLALSPPPRRRPGIQCPFLGAQVAATTSCALILLDTQAKDAHNPDRKKGLLITSPHLTSPSKEAFKWRNSSKCANFEPGGNHFCREPRRDLTIPCGQSTETAKFFSRFEPLGGNLYCTPAIFKFSLWTFSWSSLPSK
jgi:hypothetical protein